MHDLPYNTSGLAEPERLMAQNCTSFDQRRRERIMIIIIYVWKVLERLVPNFPHPIIATLSDRRGKSRTTISNVDVDLYMSQIIGYPCT